MTVAHNLTAYNAQRQFNLVNKSRAKSAEKLSSGFRVNRAADDAAGLAISEKMRRQIRGLNQGAENIQDGISLCQVADGALSEVHDMLHRMTELSVKASNDTLSAEDRAYIQDEVNHLSEEINRIGSSTRFNDQLIFDSEDHKVDAGSITELVTCASAEKGYLSEAYRVANGTYMPAAYVDFSNVNEDNIKFLNNGNFGFYCSRGCDEVFDITFKTDDTPSSARNLGDASHIAEHHYYTVNISDCKNGSDVIDAILSYVGDHLPYQRPEETPVPSGDLAVSHSNNLAKVGDAQLCIYANRRVVRYGSYNPSGYATAEAAANAYPIPNYITDQAGKVFCSRMTDEVQEEPVLNWRIQCSSEVGDVEYVRTYRMNAKVIGVDPLDVSSQGSASNSIEKVKNAMTTISRERSDIGAQQNRLIHAYNTNLNTTENTQVAESKIRDTDMAKEMVQYSLSNILAQAGQSMMSQANQSNQGVLSLLS